MFERRMGQFCSKTDCKIRKMIVLVVIGSLCCLAIIMSYKILQPNNPKNTYPWLTDFKLINEKELGTFNPSIEQTLSARLEKLKQSCNSLYQQEIKTNYKVPQLVTLDKWHQYSVCKIAKAGSRAWIKLSDDLVKQNIKKGISTYIISARDPLSRLFSVYKDKFLGGSPIYAYDDKWRSDTGSGQTFDFRWKHYWLPALISSRRLPPQISSQSMILVKDINTISSAFIHDNTSSCLLNMIKKHFPEYSSIPISPAAKYHNMSFTFEEFITHIIWTHDIGCADRHWQTQNILCAACEKNVDYVLHTENSYMEVPYLLNKLGFEIDKFAKVHKSIDISGNNDYEEYFNSLPNELFVRVKMIYENDISLFY